MTFIDNSASKPTIAQIVLFAILSFGFLLCTIYTTIRTNTQRRRHYQHVYSVRLLFPLACLFSSIENILLASSGIILDNGWDDVIYIKIIFVLQAMQVPILLVTVFELTYLVHKRRSVSFYWMHFDEGRLGQSVQGVFTTPVKSILFRNLLRILAIVLLLIGIIVNLDLLRDFEIAEDNEYAGRTGWWNLWTKQDGGRIWTIYDTHVFLSLLPPVVLVVCSTSLSIVLWRYGTSISMVVHSSFLNPWFFPLFGTIAIAVGQLFSVSYYPITSNAGFLIYVLTLVLLMVEIDKDIVKTMELTDFLHRVAKKGDAISVKRWKKESHMPLTVKDVPTMEELEDESLV